MSLGIGGNGIEINENEGVKGAEWKEKLENARTARVKKLVVAVNSFFAKSKSDFSQTDMYGE